MDVHACLLLLLVTSVGASSWFNEFFWWLGERRVCYDGLGCFSTDFPFSNTEGHLPQSPKVLNVRILLYTRGQGSNGYDATDAVGQMFDKTKNFKMIIHGYFNTLNETWVHDMKDAFLRKEDCNVFVLDWSKAARSIIYLQSVANARLVAAITARYLEGLIEDHDVDVSKLHLIGFSLGAHLAGYIGSAIPNIGRITGLDPAGPSFEGKDKRVRLDDSDAVFVDVIHTDSDPLINRDLSPGFGTIQRMGDADFYVNGGSDQPGCANNMNQHLLNILTGNFNYKENFGCSHLRALSVFTESINDESDCTFKSCPCELSMLNGGSCHSCEDSVANYLGDKATVDKKGSFYTRTGGTSPFCLN